MALDLTQRNVPLDLNEPALQEVLIDLQGNILNGHGRDHAVHLFISIDPGKAAEARAFLREFGRTTVTSAYTQLRGSEQFKLIGKDAGLFAHVALSSAGMDVLGMAKKPEPGNPTGVAPAAVEAIEQRSKNAQTPAAASDKATPAKKGAEAIARPKDAFELGMVARGPILNDPDVSTWDPAFQMKIHLLIILADDNPANLIQSEKAVLLQIAAFSAQSAIERGFTLERTFEFGGEKRSQKVEHFGYVDGISQPALLNSQLRQAASEGTTVWDPSAPPRLVLVPDPNGKPGVSFGSYLVFRKLEQNVRKFKEAERAINQELGLPNEMGGAMAVGRYQDGTPIVLQPGPNLEPANNFDYSGDKAANVCPYHAHIRKSNPRKESVRAGGPFAGSDEIELGHRIARRGIPYGGGLSNFSDPQGLPEGGVGLLFMCFQANLENQFEFIQFAWCNNTDFLEPGFQGIGSAGYASGTGVDAVIGQTSETSSPNLSRPSIQPRNWPSGWGRPVRQVQTDFSGFVTLKGGEYFFSPCISSLTGL